MNIAMAENKNQRRAKEFDENIWKFPEEELENMQGECISQESQEEQTKEKNEKRQTEKKLEIEEMWKNDKLSQWDWKKKRQDRKDRKDIKDLSTLTDIKTSPSSKSQIIRFILKHDGSQLKVLKIKDFSTQVHPNDLDDPPSSERTASICHEASNAPLLKTKSSSPMRTLQWVESLPSPESDFVESRHPTLLELTPDETDVLKPVLAERRHSTHREASNARLRKSKSSSPMKTSYWRKSPPRPERKREDSNQVDFDTLNWSSKGNQCKCWNCGSPFHSYTTCDVPKVRLFCYKCGEPGATRNKCLKCSKTSRTKQEVDKLYNWCTRCGNQGVDIFSCPKCNEPTEFNKTL